MTLIYKICTSSEWREAAESGAFSGSSVDIRDGFVHFSTASQAEATLGLYFAGIGNLVLVAFDTDVFGSDLRYEPSRGGDKFPHLYRPLDPRLALWVRPVETGRDGAHRLPDLGA